ncbi:MAG: hypothetical protein EOO02_05575 [Chitinophagaceae bacterium]|nr:MAG: hypothetical protein EOO02_05575 [Chitinophagaceae bacterium]
MKQLIILFTFSALALNSFAQYDTKNNSESKPNVIGTFSIKDMQKFLRVYREHLHHEFLKDTTLNDKPLNGVAESSFVKQKEFRPGQNSIIFYLSEMPNPTELIQYRVVHNKKQDEWTDSDGNSNFIWLQDLKPGAYKLQLRYSIQPMNVSEYTFEIEPSWHQTLAFKIIGSTLFMIFISFMIITYILYVQRAKTRKENLQKRIVQAEIKSIRSQFNPHFVFNSISSIQALITNNDMKGANQYLTSFSTLMRDSLHASAHENSSLSKETKMLNSYLQIEQLRFGFQYYITSADSINPDAIEIPSLLIQPLVENAVKHGVSDLYENGKVEIIFAESDTDLIATISDNGKGFDVTKPVEGFGMKMTKERIQLLNTTYRDQSITLTVDSTSAGTKIYVNFKNWFA